MKLYLLPTWLNSMQYLIAFKMFYLLTMKWSSNFVTVLVWALGATDDGNWWCCKYDCHRFQYFIVEFLLHFTGYRGTTYNFQTTATSLWDIKLFSIKLFHCFACNCQFACSIEGKWSHSLFVNAFRNYFRKYLHCAWFHLGGKLFRQWVYMYGFRFWVRSMCLI